MSGSLSSPEITTPVIVRFAALAKNNALAKRHIKIQRCLFLINCKCLVIDLFYLTPRAVLIRKIISS